MKGVSTVKRVDILLDSARKTRNGKLGLENTTNKEEITTTIVITEKWMRGKGTTERKEKGRPKNTIAGIIKKEMKDDMNDVGTNVPVNAVTLLTNVDEATILDLVLKAMIGGTEVLPGMSATTLIGGGMIGEMTEEMIEGMTEEMIEGMKGGMIEEINEEMTVEKREGSNTTGTTTEEALHRGRTHREGDLIESDVVGLAGFWSLWLVAGWNKIWCGEMVIVFSGLGR